MELFLIRHAQSANNAGTTEQRVADPGLTSLGIEQAERVAAISANWNLTRLITSPFLRTLLTTQPIHKATGLVPEVRTLLHEVGGCYSGYEAVGRHGQPGLNASEIQKDFGYHVESEIDERGWWRSQPFETWDMGAKRASELVKQTLKEFAGTNERVAYVMHADIKMLFVERITTSFPAIPCNTAVSRLAISADSQELLDYNEVGHLPESMWTV